MNVIILFKLKLNFDWLMEKFVIEGKKNSF